MTASMRVRLLMCFLVTLAIPVGAAAWKEVVEAPQLDFPRDHGAHPDYRTEWWYLTGLVEDEKGNRFGVQVTFFRQGTDPAQPKSGESVLRARQILAGHLAVADLGRGEFRHAERLRRTAGGLAGAATHDLSVWLDSWRLDRRADGSLHVRADDRRTALGLDLELEPTRPLVMHGDAGRSQKGPGAGNASVYLSWTRLAARGALTIDGRSLDVEGRFWFDHEWGSSQLGPGVNGWDWFSLRLDDGSDLMVYRLRMENGAPSPHSSGTLRRPDGSLRRLGVDDVVLDVLEQWRSPATDAVYPSSWRLAVPSAAIDLRVQPLLVEAEVDGRRSTGVIYWEGPVSASGSHRGEGYVELTGYATGLEGRF